MWKNMNMLKIVFFFHLKVNYIKFSSFKKLIWDFPNIGQVIEMATNPLRFLIACL